MQVKRLEEEIAKMGDSRIRDTRPLTGRATIAAIIAPCSSRKEIQSPRQARAVSLPIALQKVPGNCMACEAQDVRTTGPGTGTL